MHSKFAQEKLIVANPKDAQISLNIKIWPGH